MTDRKNPKQNGGKPQDTEGEENRRASPAPAVAAAVKPPEGREAPGETAETPQAGFQRERVNLATTVTGGKSEMVERARVETLARATEYDVETLTDLQRLDIQKPASEQPKPWATFQAMASVLMVLNILKNAQANIGTPEELRKRLRERPFLPPHEATFAGILDQLAAHPNAALKKDIDSVWLPLLTLARQTAATLPQIETLQKKGWGAPREQNAKGGIVGQAIARFEQLPIWKKFAVGLGAAGLVGFLGWLIFRKKKGAATAVDAAKKEGGSSVLGTALKWGTVGTLAYFSIGYIKKHYPELLAWWNEKKEPSFASLAKRMEVKPDTCEKLGRESYVKFMNGELHGWDYVLNQSKITAKIAQKIPTAFGKKEFFGQELPLSGVSLNEIAQVRNILGTVMTRPKVQEAFKQHHVDITSEHTTLATVFAVLENLHQRGVLDQEIKAVEEEEKKNVDPERDAIVETDDKGNGVGVMAKTLDEIGEMVGDETSRVRQVFEKWKKIGYEKIPFRAGEFAEDVTRAYKETSVGALVILGTQIGIWNGVKYMVLTSFDTMVSTFKTVAEALFLEEVTKKDVWDTWMNHAEGFMLIGAGWGLLTGLNVPRDGAFAVVPKNFTGTILNRLGGAAHGAFKGALFPITTATKGAIYTERVVHEAKTLKWRVKRLFTGREAHATFWGEQARIEAEAFQRWFQWRQKVIHGQSIVGKILIPEDIEANTERYARKFSRAYHEFARAHNVAFADEIRTGIRKALDVFEFDPNVEEKYLKLMKIIDDSFPESAAGKTLRATTTYDEALKTLGKKPGYKPSETRLAKFWAKASDILGPAAAAATIHYLETAEDKKKAVAEIALGHIGFVAGVQVMERTYGKYLKDPRLHGSFALLTGMAFALGCGGLLNDIINDYFLRWPGAHKSTEAIAAIIELQYGKVFVKGIGRLGMKYAPRLAEKAAAKASLGALERALVKKLETSAVKAGIRNAVARGLAKGLAKRLGVKLGARGAVMVAGHAIPGVNLLALAADAILLPFMAKDVYDVVSAYRTASTLDDLMRARRDKPFLDLEILEPAQAKADFEKQKMTLLQDDRAAIAFFEKLPHAKVKITRLGVDGPEMWTFTNGDITGLAVYDGQDKLVASMDGRDMETLGNRSLPTKIKEEPAKKPASPPQPPAEPEPLAAAA